MGPLKIQFWRQSAGSIPAARTSTFSRANANVNCRGFFLVAVS